MGFGKAFAKLFDIPTHDEIKETPRAKAPINAVRLTAGGQPEPVVDYRFVRRVPASTGKRTPTPLELSLNNAFTQLKVKADKQICSYSPLGELQGATYVAPQGDLSIEEIAVSRFPVTPRRQADFALDYVAGNAHPHPQIPQYANANTAGAGPRTSDDTANSDNRELEQIDVPLAPVPAIRLLATAVPNKDAKTDPLPPRPFPLS